ncbi:MAG: phytanoyl-CoA hydroxylase [Ilumatobacteraceae bacterium]|nr:phytanoyl-CoA hydroxylase [Ilumatobacteraceae bacterium]
MLDGMADGMTEDCQFHAMRVGVRRARAYALAMGSVLDDRQIEQYQHDGFLVLEGFVDTAACDDLKAAANQIVADFQPTGQRTVFTTNEQERASNDEFLASGSAIWCFFEEEAFDDEGALRTAKELSINKIGHAMHDLDPAFEKFSYRPELAGVAADIGLADALALQSMYIFKQPLIGGEVGCHQDSTFLFTDPMTVTGFWFAIEDATLQNGCLWAKPGGHRTALRKLFKRAGDTDADGTLFQVLDTTPLPSPSELVPLAVPAGTMIILNGLLPHWSDINRSPKSRHAYSLHCISAAADYPKWNWLQRPADMPLRSLAGVAA